MVIYASHPETMRSWKFVNPQTHRIYGSEELLLALRLEGFESEDYRVENVELFGGVRGFLLVTQSRITSWEKTDPVIPARKLI